jgi:protein-L-isoaspartate O-methyltransferase
VLVQEDTDIKYGVTRVMSIETIMEFFDKYKKNLNDLGYEIKNSF